MPKSRHILEKSIWGKVYKKELSMQKRECYENILYTKINNIEKSGQRIKEKE